MSLETIAEFWHQVRRLVPGPVVPDEWVNAPPADYLNLESRLASTAARWFDAETVADYSAADFQFLAESERAVLAESVAEVETALRAADGDPSTRAAQALARIVRLLAFDRYFDPLAFYLGKRIEARIGPRRPSNLVALKYISGQDSSDEPVLRIWGMLDEPDENRFAAQARTLKEIVFEAALAVDRKRWPHVRFWHAPGTASPEQEPAEEQAVPA